MSIQIPMFIQVGEENPIFPAKTSAVRWPTLRWCGDLETRHGAMCHVLGGGMAWLVVVEWKYNGGKTT
jgi:hypothetical protein